MDTHADTAQNGPPNPTETLEQRLRRLEDALANLQDTHTVEQRIVERLSERLPPPGSAPAPPPGGASADRRTLASPGLQLPLPLSTPSLPLPHAFHQAWLLF